ncbi:MAG: class I SAM-dependent DNA methyltransferase [Alphaproteobacteria bacterium]|nr:class I SAM-dependent DNA methyltransferase [Alphaproteobacteria bacterium]
MNIAEIESELQALADAPFDPATFVFRFLEIYDAPKSTLTKLKQGTANHASEPGDLLWKNNLFFRVAPSGKTAETVDAMLIDPLVKRHKPRFIMAVDGNEVYVRDLKVDQTVDTSFKKLNDAFLFFLPLAGIERYDAVTENEADIKATARVAKLYDAILQANPDWIDRDHTHELNLFMTRMLFCFFAESTSIFEKHIFTNTVINRTDEDGSNAHAVLSVIFRAMNTPKTERSELPAFARNFEYVNGGLFRDDTSVPLFNKRALRLLKECGELDWKAINPDIFGSMIQAVAQPGLREDMGLHYTSIPNIMKALQPLFLLSLEEDFEAARNSELKLKKLLQRIYNIRVFDPACGSGNFLIIAYKELRKLEMRIFERQKQIAKQWSLAMTGLHLNQFFGIELTDFAAETAKLSLWIAEYQMNEQFKAIFGSSPPSLPLRDSGNILQENAARLPWDSVCPPSEGAEIYIVGNPPFEGARGQSESQKADINFALGSAYDGVNSLDYVCIWFHLAGKYIKQFPAQAAFVATSSICQGQSVSLFWSKMVSQSVEIGFAHSPFKWRNNATHNAAVNCVIVGIRRRSAAKKIIFDEASSKVVANISPYLTDNDDVVVEKRFQPPVGLPALVMGNQAIDGGHLILSKPEMEKIVSNHPSASRFIRPVYGANDFVRGESRFCIWVHEQDYATAKRIPEFAARFDKVREYREVSGEVARSLINIPYRFRYVHEAKECLLVVPRTTTERREYIACGVLDKNAIVTDAVQVIYDPQMYLFGILSSKVHIVWVKAVAGKFKTDPRYSNTLVYNTFPLPTLSDEQRNVLEEHAFEILRVRESFPGKTLGWLYDPDTMPDDLLKAHHDLDDTLERIYIGRPFKNDTERLEHLFKLYAAKRKKDGSARVARVAGRKESA